jgi:LCP family protein required for cell wall assembly
MSPGRRRLVRAAVAVATLLGLVVMYHLGLYFYVDQKIDRVNALATDGPEVIAPQLQTDTDTYLVVGTDVPGLEGPASVATLLATVSPKGDRAVLVSVPPTALVDTPVCRTDDGSLREPTTEAFAGALLDGGPSCLVRAVQQLSGLRVDHYLGVDLAGLPGMVDALGGVPFCTVASPAVSAAAVPPAPGATELTGDQAAGFLKPADGAADVSGAAVAERAQRLLISTLRTATSMDTVVDTPTFTRFLSRAAGALTVDELTTLGDLRSLAGSLGDLSGDAVERTGLPIAETGYVPAGSKQPYVLLDGEATRTLFDSVIKDTRVPRELLAGAGEGGGEDAAGADEAAGEASAAEEKAAPPAQPEKPAPADGVTVPPAQVTVDVLNATGTKGLAATAAEALKAEGFTVGEVGNEPGPVSSSVVRFGPDVEAQARTAAAAVPGAVLQGSDALAGKVQIVLGPGYSSVVPVQVQVQVQAPAPAPQPQTPDTPAAAAPASSATPASC